MSKETDGASGSVFPQSETIPEMKGSIDCCLCKTAGLVNCNGCNRSEAA